MAQVLCIEFNAVSSRQFLMLFKINSSVARLWFNRSSVHGLKPMATGMYSMCRCFFIILTDENLFGDTRPGIGVKSPKCGGSEMDGLVTDSPVTRLVAGRKGKIT
jgi:hypothetical protein